MLSKNRGGRGIWIFSGTTHFPAVLMLLCEPYNLFGGTTLNTTGFAKKGTS